MSYTETQKEEAPSAERQVAFVPFPSEGTYVNWQLGQSPRGDGPANVVVRGQGGVKRSLRGKWRRGLTYLDIQQAPSISCCNLRNCQVAVLPLPGDAEHGP